MKRKRSNTVPESSLDRFKELKEEKEHSESSPDEEEDDEEKVVVEEEEEEEEEDEEAEMDGEEDSAQEEEAEEIEGLPLEVLMEQEAQGRRTKRKTKQDNQTIRKKKKIKGAPEEQSSRKPVGRFRVSITSNKTRPRDPRFFEACGELDESKFQQDYAFLNEIQARELEDLKERVKKERDPYERELLEKELNQKLNKERTMKRKEKEKEVLKKWYKEQRQRVTEGKKPFFLKSSEKKKLIQVEKFKELKKQNRLESYLAKKRRKNAKKDRKKLPRVS